LCAKQCARSVLRIIRTTTSSGLMLEAFGKRTPTQTGQTPIDLTSFGKKELHGQARRRRICCSCRSSTRFPHVSRLGLRRTVLFGAHQAKVGTSSLCLLRITDTLTLGSFFGGAPAAIEWYLDAFMTYTRHYMELGYFAGKDQEVINALLLLYPEHFITLFARDPRAPSSPGQSYYGWLGYCGDPWCVSSSSPH